MDKKLARLRRAAKARAIIRSLGVNRLTVHKTPRHIYAQVTSADGARVLVSASTVQTEIKGNLRATGNIEAARVVGKTIAERALSAGITNVAFDRSGFKYHGRIKALADAAREAGLLF
ncbi:50S ribosomal protein L18 [Methylocaldum szegediense]|jgi:large subunit ribosomal protein L18|uniref:Large ribosomal subunit protein uL18 n=1 Tax=Methylocaldum szegediense TaxID=73780 RepID=A0ABM9I5M6_9GAMM|nr:50S ribosomal protein L18 [Methylocaldum szegediense]CAI8908231.1 50S ribosomal subunit protein L18 [Methylocaldum szegediense]